MNRIATCWDSYRCWRSESTDYAVFFKNNCAGLREEEESGKTLEMSPSNPMSSTMTEQKSLPLQGQHQANVATLALAPGLLASWCSG